jgi:hypothetical protein
MEKICTIARILPMGFATRGSTYKFKPHILWGEAGKCRQLRDDVDIYDPSDKGAERASGLNLDIPDET